MTKMLRVLVLLFITSCSTAIKNSSDYDFLLYDATLKEDVIPNSNSSSVVTKEEDLLGYWVGWTQAKDSADWYHANEHTISDGSYKILISFDSIVDNDIIGHTVVANQYNRFEASAYQSNGIWEIFIGSNIRRSDTSNEFKLQVRQHQGIMQGNWTRNNSKFREREVLLQKIEFKYNPKNRLQDKYVDWDNPTKMTSDITMQDLDDTSGYHWNSFVTGIGAGFDTMNDEIQSLRKKWYLIEWNGYMNGWHYKASSEAVHKLNASQYKLKPHDLENLSQEDLLVLRNSIYARHGYSFKDFKLMVYFMKQPWYLPIYSNIQTKFTKRELHNIELILRYEEHAKSYYDRFGRG